MAIELIGLGVLGAGLAAIAIGATTVRPRERGLVERFGKYHRFAESGFHFIIPLVEKIYKVDTTEQMINAEKQEVITKDALNAEADAQIYFKIKADEGSVKDSQYNVDDIEIQMPALARTSLRNIIGNLPFVDVNSDRNKINKELQAILRDETKTWGVEILRAELQEITPPKAVQESMSKVLIAENTKISAVNEATALETMADGEKRAAIKKAEGQRQAEILNAEGNAKAVELQAKAQAEAIKLVNSSAAEYFKGNAVELKKLEVVQASLAGNSKIILPEGTSLTAVFDGIAGITPVKAKLK